MSVNLLEYERASIVKNFAIHESDTGSFPVQIALMTYDINSLSVHSKNHPKDFSALRTLIILISRRAKFMKHLKKENLELYLVLNKKLGLRDKK